MSLSQNYFELFGFPVAFEIDQQLLAERYRDLQRSLHPDRYANAPDQERLLSVQQAAQVNEAFRVLKSVMPRARYLLQLKGVEFDDERETHFDPEFLMEQIELREALGSVRTATDPLSSLTEIMSDLGRRQAEIEKELAGLFESPSDENFLHAKQVVQKMQFLLRLQQEAEELEEDLVDSL